MPLESSIGLRSGACAFEPPIFAIILPGVWYTVPMIINFKGEIFYWRGPAPFLFVAVPEQSSRELKAISSMVTYGWGVIPVQARIGKTDWKTSLFPKEGRYLVPIRKSVQKSENLEVGDSVSIQLEIN